jgi:alkylation response protein AidB-like acyl-CoA dehydrogenase
MPYVAPLAEYKFFFDHIVGFSKICATARFEDVSSDITDALLSEAGKVCEEVLIPLQRVGDIQHAVLKDGVVVMPDGFKEAYRALADGGWMGISAHPDGGGMGLPLTLTSAVNEMMASACLSLQLNPLMTQGQIEALEAHADEKIKQTYLPKLISGEWSGTMNLTEPQAGSDVGALITKAVPRGDGTFEITGQKIYISYGDHDMAENICHLVLARLPDAPAGTKGISLFMVPKYLPDDNGDAGQANALHVVSLEHKMGLHASPTAVMQYDGATGWLVGAEHAGMAAMFTMMNNARVGVAIQGTGVAEGALQHALSYARDRKQGRTTVPNDAVATGAIVDHADVRRMLAAMKADLFAARAIALSCAAAIDMGTATSDAFWHARAAFLTPIAKTFGTDVGIAVAAEGIQVHGGMGFIEETGAAQYSRDARVTAIYEGTNGIQAMDLVARKLADGGDAAFALIEEVQTQAEGCRGTHESLAGPLWEASETLRETTEWMVSQSDSNQRFAGAVPYLRGFARVLGGHYHLKAALAAGPDSGRARLARFYIKRLLSEHTGLLAHAREGADDLYALSTEDLLA